MSIVEPGVAPSGLVARVKAILMQPAATWDVIDSEPATIGGLYRSYIIPLAAIGPICQFLHNLLFGMGVPGLISIRISPIWLGVNLIVSYVFSLAIIYVFALIIDALAPTFGGTKNQIQAFKVAAYAPTAGWVAAVLLLVPMLGILAVLGGLYSLYLLYRGLPRLMKTTEDKALPYTALVVVAGLVVGLVAGAIWGSVSMMARGSMFGGPLAAQSHISGNVN
ncbi:MAG TPA: YIP1 family protein, partial [Phenylobacterium sp.]|nr:YIP1 family protein [Phenylobacterium sp.]